MVFSSSIFLFIFLPVVITVYYLIPQRWRALRNLALLFPSLLFYAWGEVVYSLLMLASIVANYVFGVCVDRCRGTPAARKVVSLAVVVNIGLLIAFKYANFFADNLNVLLAWLHLGSVHLKPIALPIGISFYTFQALSYVIDVYRNEGKVQRDPTKVGLFVSLFPQLIAGPIVRYRDIAREIVSRAESSRDFILGVRRFIIGLGKKVLIANAMAGPADQVFALAPGDLTPGLAWCGVVCYGLQIYFDFSGYSDMAIGMGRMFGFHFLENFNFPYISQSMTEFWRRWHISLSTWFRDYLYVPMGGNRGSRLRTYANLLIVFFLCGLWHGAKWNFVVWGLFHGAFLVAERMGRGTRFNVWVPLKHAYVLVVVLCSWALFRAESLSQGVAVLAAMAGHAHGSGIMVTVPILMTHENALVMLVGMAGSLPISRWLGGRWKGLLSNPPETWSALAAYACAHAVLFVGLGLVLVACAMKLASGTHNPFIYYRF